jgi:hypothetical protein
MVGNCVKITNDLDLCGVRSATKAANYGLLSGVVDLGRLWLSAKANSEVSLCLRRRVGGECCCNP